MPPTQPVNFKAVLEKGNRLQIPKLVQRHFNITTTSVIEVNVYLEGSFGTWHSFYAKPDSQGRILLPKLILALIGAENGSMNFAGRVFNVLLRQA